MNIPKGCNPSCPSCTHGDKTPEESIAQKADWLGRRLSPWSAQLAPVVVADRARHLGYRDRVSLVAMWRDGRWRFGVTRRDEFVPIHDCPVHSRRVRAVVWFLSDHLPSPEGFNLAFLVLSGAQTVLVLKQPAPPAADWLTGPLTGQLAVMGVEGLWLHCFPSAGRHLFTKNGWHRLWGQRRSRDDDGFWYGAGAFSQLLPELHGQSLDEAEAFLAPEADDYVLDLYCGRGVSLRRWLDRGAKVLGVELGGEALACAQLNVPEAMVLRGGCAQRIPQMQHWWRDALPQRRLCYVNPPRTGLEPAVLGWLAGQSRPRRIAYLSCSAGTLRRDLSQLCQAGYRVARITPYDFFPRTYHVETLALLSLS